MISHFLQQQITIAQMLEMTCMKIFSRAWAQNRSRCIHSIIFLCTRPCAALLLTTYPLILSKQVYTNKQQFLNHETAWLLWLRYVNSNFHIWISYRRAFHMPVFFSFHFKCYPGYNGKLISCCCCCCC